VFKARCKRTGDLVALKKVLMDNENEGVCFCRISLSMFLDLIFSTFQFPITALREIKMLQMVRHENITELIEICSGHFSFMQLFAPALKASLISERGSRGHVFYLVFSFCAHDLSGLLASPQGKFFNFSK
jgi:cyclin-dependent kinase 9